MAVLIPVALILVDKSTFSLLSMLFQSVVCEFEPGREDVAVAVLVLFLNNASCSRVFSSAAC